MSEQEATQLLQGADGEAVWENDQIDYSKLELSEEVIQLNRVAKVVKGGRRFSFSALVVVGDRDGHVGVGFGKANEVPESIQKAVQNGKKNLIRVQRVRRTIPYTVIGRYGAARVMLRPASEGTGLIAGPAARAVLELAGIHDILTKTLGSSNVLNILKAIMDGLKQLRDAEEVMQLRGKNLEEVVGPRRAKLLRESRNELTPAVGETIEEQASEEASTDDAASSPAPEAPAETEAPAPAAETPVAEAPVAEAPAAEASAKDEPGKTEN